MQMSKEHNLRKKGMTSKSFSIDLLEELPIVFCRYESSGNIKYANKNFLKFFKLTKKSLKTRNLFELINLENKDNKVLFPKHNNKPRKYSIKINDIDLNRCFSDFKWFIASKQKNLFTGILLYSIKTNEMINHSLIKENEELLSIFDSMDEIIYISDPDSYELLYFNEPFNKLFNGRIGEKCYKVLQGRDEPCPFCTNDKIFGDNLGETEIWEFQNELTGRWYRCIDRAILWPNEKMVRFEIALDITVKKLITDKIIENEDKYRTFIEQSTEGFVLLDESGRIIEWNKAREDMTGLKKEEVYGKRLWEAEKLIIPPEFDNPQSEKYFNTEMDTALQTGESVILNKIIEVDIIKRGGSRITIDTSVFPIKTTSGFRLGSISHDVTKRKLHEAELKKHQYILRESQKIAKIGSYDIDLISHELFLTEETFRILGLSPSQKAPNLNEYHNYIHPEDIETVTKNFNDSVSKGKNIDLIYRIKRTDGEVRYVHSIAQPIKNRKNKVTNLIGSLRDITDQKLAEDAIRNSEKKLRELNATKDKFFSIIAHDLKSPFQGLLGYSTLLCDEIESLSKDDISQISKGLRETVSKQLDLLKNLLDWARIQTGTLKIEQSVFPLSLTITYVLELLKETASLKKINFICDNNKNYLIRADENMIRAVLQNLISNAIKFSHHGSSIMIESECIDDFIKLSVIDNGIGISSSVLNDLFRIDNHHTTTGTANEKGTGLGLVLCKEMVELNGGKIWAESTEGKGSNFCFTIPIVKSD